MNYIQDISEEYLSKIIKRVGNLTALAISNQIEISINEA